MSKICVYCTFIPKVKQELIDGILAFWRTVDQAKCRNMWDTFAKYYL